jgi:5'-3' exonuclease
MGLPGFFSWILKRYIKAILKQKLSSRPKYLYIDANCLFHPECFKVLEGFPNDNIKDLELKMFQRIANFLHFIEKYVDPTDMMYIAVDGTAPIAKIMQQRKRRYKSELDNKMKNELKEKFGKQANSTWSNTSITPGTEFMENLHQYLNEHYKAKKSSIKYIYSSFHTPGEGEHKIMEHIKHHTSVDDDIVVYGLDADLIFLTMSSGRHNIHLIREKLEFKRELEDKKQNNINMDNAFNPQVIVTGDAQIETPAPKAFDYINDVEKEMIYVSISETKKAYNNEMKSYLFVQNRDNIRPDMISELQKINFADDFIFLCFLLGNDFLPHFPSIDIHTGGLDELIGSYINALLITNKSLININNRKVTINTEFLRIICEDMGDKESNYFYNTLYEKMERNKRRVCQKQDEYEKELWNLENLKQNQTGNNDVLQLGVGSKEVWKYRYYDYYFKTSGDQTNVIDQLCQNYIDGIKWITEYYFDTCPDWKWHYIPYYAPFVSDIAVYILKNNIEMNDIKFNKRKSIPMMSQLVSVMPPSCSYLLPKSYRSLVTTFESPIIDMFPSKIKIDTLYKNQLWQCVPRMPYLDIERVLSATENLAMCNEEKKRCKILSDFVY